jgi:hypothetical protein
LLNQFSVVVVRETLVSFWATIQRNKDRIAAESEAKGDFVRILTASAFFLILATGAAQAQVTTDSSVTLLATGTVTPMYGYPIGTLDSGSTPKIGDTLQFEYTVDPSANPTQDPSMLGPITAIAYSLNGSPFFPDNGYGTFSVAAGSGYNFTLFPGNGAEISLSIDLGPGAPARIIPGSTVDTIPNFGLVAGAPPGSVTTSMLVYDLSGAGAYANINSLKEIIPASAPEIDPAGLASGLTLLLGGLFVIQGRRTRDKSSSI